MNNQIIINYFYQCALIKNVLKLLLYVLVFVIKNAHWINNKMNI